MSTITIFNNQNGSKGNHTQHTQAYALIECDDYYDDVFMSCIGDDIYSIMDNIEEEGLGYFYTYDLVGGVGHA